MNVFHSWKKIADCFPQTNKKAASWKKITGFRPRGMRDAAQVADVPRSGLAHRARPPPGVGEARGSSPATVAWDSEPQVPRPVGHRYWGLLRCSPSGRGLFGRAGRTGRTGKAGRRRCLCHASSRFQRGPPSGGGRAAFRWRSTLARPYTAADVSVDAAGSHRRPSTQPLSRMPFTS